MSIYDRLAAVATELHLTGYGHDLNAAVCKIARFFADEMHALTGGQPSRPTGTVPSVPALVTDPTDPAFKYQVTDDAGFVWQALVAEDPPGPVEWLCCGTVAQVAEGERLLAACHTGITMAVAQAKKEIEAGIEQSIATAINVRITVLDQYIEGWVDKRFEQLLAKAAAAEPAAATVAAGAEAPADASAATEAAAAV